MSTPEKSTLGQAVTYKDQYDANLLFPIPRIEKRTEIELPSELPFHGVDLWTSYEISWLNPKGRPHVRIAEFSFEATSPNIIESKSFKLYLNSFNQTHFENESEVIQTMERDLSAASGAKTTVSFVSADAISTFEGESLDELDIEMNSWELNPAHLKTQGNVVTETLYSDLLKSNCLVTGQPDWGSVIIKYTGGRIDRRGLLKYILSFRQHNEFHEQCVERMFWDITRHCSPEKLTVYARYTRRGGLDINPFRSNFEAPYQRVRLARQ